jgi:mono/diheme cytochrome c family protein
MLGAPCIGSGNEGPRPSGRIVLAIVLAAAGATLAAPTLPLLAYRPAQEEQPPAPKPPAPSRPGAATSREGEQFFFDRGATAAGIACADCHLITAPTVAPPDDLIRPGHNLFDAFGRGTWWNGRITTDCGQAAEVCFKRFQGAEELPPWARVALVKYMKSRSAPVSNPWILLRVPPGRSNVGAGAEEQGRDLFRRTCAVCHPGGAAASEGGSLRESTMTPREIADLIRAGRGRMPFYQADILSDEAVADLAVYAHSLRPRPE